MQVSRYYQADSSLSEVLIHLDPPVSDLAAGSGRTFICGGYHETVADFGSSDFNRRKQYGHIRPISYSLKLTTFVLNQVVFGNVFFLRLPLHEILTVF